MLRLPSWSNNETGRELQNQHSQKTVPVKYFLDPKEERQHDEYAYSLQQKNNMSSDGEEKNKESPNSFLFHTGPFKKIFKLIDEHCNYRLASQQSHPLILYGPSGTGKDACLTHWELTRINENRHLSRKSQSRNEIIVSHYVGVTKDSVCVADVLYRLSIKLKEQLQLDCDSIPYDEEKLQRNFPHLLEKAARACNLVIIIIHGIDKMIYANGRKAAFSFLSYDFPPRIRFLLSLTENSDVELVSKAFQQSTASIPSLQRHTSNINEPTQTSGTLGRMSPNLVENVSQPKMTRRETLDQQRSTIGLEHFNFLLQEVKRRDWLMKELAYLSRDDVIEMCRMGSQLVDLPENHQRMLAQFTTLNSPRFYKLFFRIFKGWSDAQLSGLDFVIEKLFELLEKTISEKSVETKNQKNVDDQIEINNACITAMVSFALEVWTGLVPINETSEVLKDNAANEPLHDDYGDDDFEEDDYGYGNDDFEEDDEEEKRPAHTSTGVVAIQSTSLSSAGNLHPWLEHILILLFVCRSGLSKKHLIGIICGGHTDRASKLNDLWNVIHICLQSLGVLFVDEQYIISVRSDGLVLRRIIFSRYLSGEESLKFLHEISHDRSQSEPMLHYRQQLAHYFEHVQPCIGGCSELIFQYVICKNYKKLKETLVNLRHFQLYWTHSIRTRGELYEMWCILITARSDLSGKYKLEREHHGKHRGLKKKKAKRQKKSSSKGDSVKNTSNPVNGLQKFDIIEEYNRAVSEWYNVARPATAELTWTLIQLSFFLYGFGKFEEMLLLPENTRPSMKPDHFAKIGIKLPRKKSNKAKLYDRWIWMQFPWIALAYAGDAVLTRRTTDTPNTLAGIRPSSRCRARIDVDQHSKTERGFWVVKKIDPAKDALAHTDSLASSLKMKAEIAANERRLQRSTSIHGALRSSSSMRDLRRGEALRRAAPLTNVDTTDDEREMIEAHFSERTVSTTIQSVKSMKTLTKLGKSVVPFSTPTIRSLRRGSRFPTVEKMQKHDPNRSLNLFNTSGLLNQEEYGDESPRKEEKKSGTRKDITLRQLRGHNEEFEDDLDHYKEDLKLLYEDLERQRHEFDELKFQYNMKLAQYKTMCNDIDQRDVQDDFTLACISAGESMMKKLEDKHLHMKHISLDGERLGDFYAEIVRLTNVYPARDARQLQGIDVRLKSINRKISQLKKQIHKTKHESRQINCSQKPALLTQLDKREDMRDEVLRRLQKKRENIKLSIQQNMEREEARRKYRQGLWRNDMGAEAETKLKNAYDKTKEKKMSVAQQLTLKRMQLSKYTAAFNRIKEITKIKSGAKIYQKFMNKDIVFESLSSQKVNMEKQLQQKKDQLLALKQEHDTLQYGSNLVSSRYMRDIDEQIFQAENDVKSNSNKVQYLSKTLHGVYAGVLHICDLCGLQTLDDRSSASLYGTNNLNLGNLVNGLQEQDNDFHDISMLSGVTTKGLVEEKDSGEEGEEQEVYSWESITTSANLDENMEVQGTSDGRSGGKKETNNSPSGRAHFSATSLIGSHSLVIYGGQNLDGYSSNMYKLSGLTLSLASTGRVQLLQQVSKDDDEDKVSKDDDEDQHDQKRSSSDLLQGSGGVAISTYQDLKWIRIRNTPGINMDGRSGHTTAIHPVSQNLYIFGGRTIRGLCNTLLVFDTKRDKWVGSWKPEKVSSGSKAIVPAPRAGAGSQIVGDALYIYGGQGVHGTLLTTSVWRGSTSGFSSGKSSSSSNQKPSTSRTQDDNVFSTPTGQFIKGLQNYTKAKALANEAMQNASRIANEVKRNASLEDSNITNATLGAIKAMLTSFGLSGISKLENDTSNSNPKLNNTGGFYDVNNSIRHSNLSHIQNNISGDGKINDNKSSKLFAAALLAMNKLGINASSSYDKNNVSMTNFSTIMMNSSATVQGGPLTGQETPGQETPGQEVSRENHTPNLTLSNTAAMQLLKQLGINFLQENETKLESQEQNEQHVHLNASQNKTERKYRHLLNDQKEEKKRLLTISYQCVCSWGFKGDACEQENEELHQIRNEEKKIISDQRKRHQRTMENANDDESDGTVVQNDDETNTKDSDTYPNQDNEYDMDDTFDDSSAYDQMNDKGGDVLQKNKPERRRTKQFMTKRTTPRRQRQRSSEGIRGSTTMADVKNINCPSALSQCQGFCKKSEATSSSRNMIRCYCQSSNQIGLQCEITSFQSDMFFSDETSQIVQWSWGFHGGLTWILKMDPSGESLRGFLLGVFVFGLLIVLFSIIIAKLLHKRI
eukprot:g4067.t1